MNILLSLMCLSCAVYLAFSKYECETQFKGGMWVTRDAKGVVLTISPNAPLFTNPLDRSISIKGIKSYGYEWEYSKEEK